jgi:hypothetical protein
MPILWSALGVFHNVVSLGVSDRRGPVLWSHVLDVRSRDCPFVAALLTFEAFDRSFVVDMSTTQCCGNHQRPRRATPEIDAPMVVKGLK